MEPPLQQRGLSDHVWAPGFAHVFQPVEGLSKPDVHLQLVLVPVALKEVCRLIIAIVQLIVLGWRESIRIKEDLKHVWDDRELWPFLGSRLRSMQLHQGTTGFTLGEISMLGFLLGPRLPVPLLWLAFAFVLVKFHRCGVI